MFFNAFWLSKAEYKSGQRIVKVIYIRCSLFYAIINYQFKTSELKNGETLVKQTAQPLKFVRIDWECAFLYNLWDFIPGRWSLKIECGPWKVLEKWRQFLYGVLPKYSNYWCSISYFPVVPNMKLNGINQLYRARLWAAFYFPWGEAKGCSQSKLSLAIRSINIYWNNITCIR